MDNFMLDLQSFQDSWWPYSVAFIVTVISAIRSYCGGNNCTSDARIEGKHVLITGSSSGIGLETAKELAKRGGNLILAVRNIAKGQQAITTIKTHYPNAKLTLKQVDLSEFSSIRKFAKEILNEYTHIDILINNAGTISHYPSNVTTEGNSTIMATNYFGPFLLTHLLLPLLHKSENGGRVINMSALAHFTGQIHIDNLNGNLTTQELFANSKLAITMMTKYMANRFKNLTNITFNSVSPGLVRGTSHLKYSFKLENFMAKLSVWPWIWLFTKTPKQGCQSVVYLAVDPNLNDISGAYFSDCEIKEPADILKNSSLLEKLYKKTCLIVDLKSDSVECFVN